MKQFIFTSGLLLVVMSQIHAGATHTVMVLLEAKPGKGKELKAALQEIVGPSRSESASLEYKLHQSKENPNQFMLYENWESSELHAKQFEKPYIKALGKK